MNNNIIKQYTASLQVKIQQQKDDYFLKDTQSKKLFSIFHLYFFAYSVDSNYERNQRPIHVTSQFISNLTIFLKNNKEYTKSLFMKIIKKIKQLFIYSIKSGLRDPLIKKNGQTFIRYPQVIKKIPKSNYSQAVEKIQKLIPDLQESIKKYSQSKQSFLQGLSSQQGNDIKRCLSFDKNITFRLNQNIKRYKADFQDQGSDREGDNQIIEE